MDILERLQSGGKGACSPLRISKCCCCVPAVVRSSRHRVEGLHGTYTVGLWGVRGDPEGWQERVTGL